MSWRTQWGDGEEPTQENGSSVASPETGKEVQHVQHEMDGFNVLRYEAIIKPWKCFQSLF